MQLQNVMQSSARILWARISRRQTPVAVRFKLTNSCALKCEYCSIWKNRGKELDTVEVLRTIDEMADAGVKHLSLSGGDPMLRDDIGIIISRAAGAGISVSMNSPGVRIVRDIGALRRLTLLKLSLDGPAAVHDRLRRQGSYQEVLQAAETARRYGVKIAFAATLTAYNINHLDHLLEVANRFQTVVAFQPLKELYKGLADMTHLAPDRQEYHAAVAHLIAEKQCGNPAIRNSLAGLRYIHDWPDLQPLHCGAGWIFCVLEPNGDMLSCDRVRITQPVPNSLKDGFRAGFKKLLPPDCRGCGFCGSLELNYLLSFRWGIINSINRIL